MINLFESLKSNKKILGEIVACKLVEGFFVLLTAKFLVEFIDAPSEMQSVIRNLEFGIGNANSFRIPNFTFLIVFFAGRIILSGVTEKLFAKLSIDMQNDFRKKIHEQIFVDEISAGELLTLTFDALKSLDEFFLKVAPHVASAMIFLPTFLICAAFVDWLTAIILLVTLPVAPLLLWLIGKATSEKNSRAWAQLQKLNGEFRELLAAITTLKLFGRVDAGAVKIRQASRKSSAATLDVLKLAFVSSFALELITTLSIALVAVTLGLRLISAGVEFKSALFLLLLAPEFFLPVRKFGVAFHVMISAKSSLERLKNFLRVEETTSGSVEKILMPPEILIDDVSFTYPQKFSPTLRHVNLKFPANKVTAIIGASGSGKSTLLKILAGLLEPDSGKIIPNSSFLIPNCSYAPQAPHLFDATLRENFLMFGTLDDANLKKFLDALNLSTLDLNSPQKLSRGQLQRLGLIRALLKDTPIILLDEPTAGLDEVTERKVLSLIKKIAPRRTIIIATHRLPVTKFADEIISL